MRMTLQLALAALTAALAGTPAQSATEVSFVKPERFRDADVAGALGEIRRHLERLGGRLDPALTLRIAVLDVDLAGREPFGQGPLAPRILDGVSWPSIEVRYTLTRGGKVIASGKDQISDRTFDMRPEITSSSSDPLRYEKAMLDRWFERQFAAYRADQSSPARRR